jgi:hypothetical protein
MMELFVKSAREGKGYTLWVRPYDTVGSVKSKIRDKESIPMERLCLLHHGKLLDDRRTLVDYRIDAESVLHLVVRIP